MSVKQLNVFLCYASEDKPKVRNLYQRLQADGFAPWIEDDLLPGQEWSLEIPKVIRDADVFIACLSPTFIAKVSYGQAQIKMALDVADRQPEGVVNSCPAVVKRGYTLP